MRQVIKAWDVDAAAWEVIGGRPFPDLTPNDHCQRKTATTFTVQAPDAGQYVASNGEVRLNFSVDPLRGGQSYVDLLGVDLA